MKLLYNKKKSNQKVINFTHVQLMSEINQGFT